MNLPVSMAVTRALMDVPCDPDDAIPACWHWLYVLPIHLQSEIGPDGHPRRDGFLPPMWLPRRMGAGSQIECPRQISLDQKPMRLWTIGDLRPKQSRTGPVIFVKVRHEIDANGVAAIHERDEIVYQDNPEPNEPTPYVLPVPAAAQWSRRVVPDGVLLFRHSALRFNGHRIRYDRRHVTGQQGCPVTVVHGPLIATLLLDLLPRQIPRSPVAHFEFKAIEPSFDIGPFEECDRREGDKQIRL